MTIPDQTRNESTGDVVDESGQPSELESPEAEHSAADDRYDATAVAGNGDQEPEALLPPDNAQRFRERWESVQAGFVDKPRDTVEQADDLVRDLVQELTSGFVKRRENLEQQWSEGDEASTEDLRVALTHYRSFFNRLLST